MFRKFVLLAYALLIGAAVGTAQNPTPPKPATTPVGPTTVAPSPVQSDSVMITIILKHQQDKNLSEIRRVLEAQGFWEVFPPEEARVVSWIIAMNLGHVIILQVPAGAIRRLNLALENGAWGAFETEIYLSYDYINVWQDYVSKREEAKEDRN